MHKLEPIAESVILQHIASVLEGLKYGVIELTIHEGRIVQIERREKIRFDAQGQRIR